MILYRLERSPGARVTSGKHDLHNTVRTYCALSDQWQRRQKRVLLPRITVQVLALHQYTYTRSGRASHHLHVVVRLTFDWNTVLITPVANDGRRKCGALSTTRATTRDNTNIRGQQLSVDPESRSGSSPGTAMLLRRERVRSGDEYRS